MPSLALLIALILPALLHPQNATYKTAALPTNLMQGATASVLQDNMDIEISAIDKMNVSVERVVTVFNKMGNKAVRNYAFYDGITKLKELNAEIFDAAGTSIEKIKKRDFKDVTAVDGFSLYTDSRLKYFEYTPLSYPYTISFKYSYETGNTAFIPPWTPVDEYGVSVRHSSYTISYPEGFEMRVKEKNMAAYPVTNSSSGRRIAYEMDNTPALARESLSPEFFLLAPRLLLALDKFHLEGLDGYGIDWNSFGKWQYENLVQRRDELPPATITKIGNLLIGIEDPIEKTKRIYQFVQENTRYISVQLGIGGWMPITAAEVDRVKNGDCKGLTNYTKALLKSQGIESFYSVVWAGNSKRSMEPDFASMQGNHVILNVPVDGRDLWLECTSQVIPFGFLGDFTDDRDVLVLTPDGGELKHTPNYADTTNLKKTIARCRLAVDGTLTGQVHITSTGIEYDNRSPIIRLSPTKKEEHYKEYWEGLNGLDIRAMSLKNEKDSIQLQETVSVEIPEYASQIGGDMLFKLNAFDVNDHVPERYRNRKQPFQISRGFLYEVTFEIQLPAGYTAKQLPDALSLRSEYGEYSMKVKQTDGTLVYTRRLLVKKGEHTSEKYEAYREFRRAIARNDNVKVVISK